MREFNPNKVTITVLISYEDIPVRGNVMASGNEEEDKEVEDDVIQDLENGNIYAWCTAVVKASWAGFTGVDSLGGISCHDEDEFIQMVKDHGMIGCAIKDLIAQIRENGWEVVVEDGSIEAIAKRYEGRDLSVVEHYHAC